MKCPNCGSEELDEAAACSHCSVVFSKLQAIHTRLLNQVPFHPSDYSHQPLFALGVFLKGVFTIALICGFCLMVGRSIVGQLRILHAALPEIRNNLDIINQASEFKPISIPPIASNGFQFDPALARQIAQQNTMQQMRYVPVSARTQQRYEEEEPDYDSSQVSNWGSGDGGAWRNYTVPKLK